MIVNEVDEMVWLHSCRARSDGYYDKRFYTSRCCQKINTQVHVGRTIVVSDEMDRYTTINNQTRNLFFLRPRKTQ